MSLVNDMLQDLQQNQSPHALDLDTQAVAQSSNWRRWIGILMLATASVIAAWWFGFNAGTEKSVVSVSQKQTPNSIDKPTNTTNDQQLIAASNAKSDQSNLSQSNMRTVGTASSDTTPSNTPAKDSLNHQLAALNQKATNKQAPSIEKLAQTKPAAEDSSITISEPELVVPSESASREIKRPVTQAKTNSSSNTSRMTERSNVKALSSAQQTADQLRQAERQLQQGNYSIADQELRKLIVVNPRLHRARELLSYSLTQQQRWFDNEALLGDAIQQFPEYSNYVLLLARQFVGQQQWQKVTQLTQSVPASDQPEALMVMAAVASQKQQAHQQAINYYQQLLNRDRQRGDWWIGLAISLTALEQNDEAARALQRAQRDPRLSTGQQQYIQQQLSNLQGQG